ncbi:hypothetical protein COV22_03765, partial [Candidatus Woesearchaeota archaeon CG10_big_fil_rev_8_21_14_0_10_47_5]
ALRSRISAEQAKLEIMPKSQHQVQGREQADEAGRQQQQRREPTPVLQARVNDKRKLPRLSEEESKTFREMLEDLIGTRGAYLLDNKLTILGKVPVSELPATLTSLSTVYAAVFDGVIERDLVRVAEKAEVNFLVGMDSKIKPAETRITVMTINDLG